MVLHVFSCSHYRVPTLQPLHKPYWQRHCRGGMLCFRSAAFARLPFFCNPGFCKNQVSLLNLFFLGKAWLGCILCLPTESVMELEKQTHVVLDAELGQATLIGMVSRWQGVRKHVLGWSGFGWDKETTAINISGDLRVAGSSQQHPGVVLSSLSSSVNWSIFKCISLTLQSNWYFCLKCRCWHTCSTLCHTMWLLCMAYWCLDVPGCPI